MNWIIETKGRVWEGTEDKDNAMDEWCKRIRECTGEIWRFKRIDQTAFNLRKSARSLADLLDDGQRLVE